MAESFLRLALNPSPTFKTEVGLSVPGRVQRATLTVEYRHKDNLAIIDWLARAPGRSDVDILDEVIASWDDGPNDERGNQVPYSPAALAVLLRNYPASKVELFRAYVDELLKPKPVQPLLKDASPQWADGIELGSIN